MHVLKGSLYLILVVSSVFGAPAGAVEKPLAVKVYEHCEACHGPAGMGGKGGEYPRIAGLPQAYIERQLNLFKTRKRLNKPMLPIFKNWRFNQEVMAAVAAHIHAMPVDAGMIPAHEPAAPWQEYFDTREEFEQVGEELFQGACAQCHGENGRGREDKESPPLVNQYPTYLKKQIGDFVRGQRKHEHAEKMFGELYEEELDSLLIYLAKLGGVQ